MDSLDVGVRLERSKTIGDLRKFYIFLTTMYMYLHRDHAGPLAKRRRDAGGDVTAERNRE